MSLRLYNTLTRQVETFAPLAEITSLYTCGPTVYDFPHIGNWAAYIRWDTLYRTLRANNQETHWVMNITDVGHLVSDADEGEDKLEKGARREGKTAWEVAEYYAKDFIDGLDKLNISIDRSNLVKATDHIKEQVALAQTLESKGFTYLIDDGLYFDTSKLADYGKLARLDVGGLRAGARVEIGDKKSPTDFALWKLSPAGSTRDMEWDSPWGKGFPGWHLECSAMAMKYLGETIDIHTGGIDHIPVHHSNEIAQSEAATGKQFVRFWLHSNFITMDNQKIAKSLGNSITLHDLQEKGYSPLELRLLVLQSHYRTQADFSWETLEGARARLKSYRQMGDMVWQGSEKGKAIPHSEFTEVYKSIEDALASDLNTPIALSILSQFAARITEEPFNHEGTEQLKHFLSQIDELFGLNLTLQKDISDEQRLLIEERSKARNSGDWQRSDALREQLKQQGINLKDIAHGQIWSRL